MVHGAFRPKSSSSQPTHTSYCIHPRHTFKGIVKSQFIRFKRISSSVYDYNEAASILIQVLRNRGYNHSFLRRVKRQIWRYYDVSLNRKKPEEKEEKQIIPVITHYDGFHARLNRRWAQLIRANSDDPEVILSALIYVIEHDEEAGLKLKTTTVCLLLQSRDSGGSVWSALVPFGRSFAPSFLIHHNRQHSRLWCRRKSQNINALCQSLHHCVSVAMCGPCWGMFKLIMCTRAFCSLCCGRAYCLYASWYRKHKWTCLLYTSDAADE